MSFAVDFLNEVQQVVERLDQGHSLDVVGAHDGVLQRRTGVSGATASLDATALEPQTATAEQLEQWLAASGFSRVQAERVVGDKKLLYVVADRLRLAGRIHASQNSITLARPLYASGKVRLAGATSGECAQALEVVMAIAPDGGQHQGISAQFSEAVGDVGCAAAKLAFEPRREKRHIEHVNLIGKDVVLEMPVEHHDGVVGHRTADHHPSSHCHSPW